MAVSVVSFSFSRAAQLEAQGPLCWIMAFFITSYQHLLWTPTHQGPNGPFGLMWLSLPHLVYLRLISQEPQLSATARRTQLAWLPSWLSYIIVQRPLDRPLDLWNRMFNRHQAEITVMQFGGHSLLVYQSMRGCPRGVMVKAMNCGIVVREFVLQSRYYVHFRANTLGKGMNPLILPPTMGK